MSDVLMEITKDQLETGMRGFPVGYCTTSKVDPQLGLYYREVPCGDFGTWDPKEVLYLLHHGKKGSESEVTAFYGDVSKNSQLSEPVIKAIEALPRQGHPMHIFSSALLILGMLEGTGEYEKDYYNVVGKLPQLVACVINHHAGWGETPTSRPELGYMENFTQMVNLPPEVDRNKVGEVFKVFNVLHYDHGGGNLSAFTGKAVASGLADMYQSLSAAMNALAGPRHGKANQDCLQFVKEVLDNVGPDASGDDVEQLIQDRLANKQLVFGFGHAVLRVEDPRATIQYEIAERLFPSDPLVKIALHLRERGPKVLKENPKISNPYPNVDAISGTLLSAAGFGYPDYYTVLFGLSRSVGIARQIVYERVEARGGKGTPIVRPKYLYSQTGTA